MNFKYLIKYKFNYIKAALTLLDNISVYLFRKTPSRGPFYVNFAVSPECNLKCSHCGKWRKTFPGPSLLSTEKKLKIINQLADSGVCYLSLYDKEPLLADDLECIILKAKERGMVVNISTNGLLLKDKSDFLIKSKVDSIIVSAESHISEIHDGMRGCPGLFDNILAGIELIRSKRLKRRPHIAIRGLITKENYPTLNDYVGFWKDKVDEIILKPISDNKTINYSIPENMRFSLEDKKNFNECYADFRKKHFFANNIYMREIPQYFFDPVKLSGKYTCFAGFLFGNIDLEGNVYFCAEQRHKIGNLQNKEFRKIWASLEAKDQRKKMSKNRECFCWLELFFLNIYLTKIFRGNR